MAHGNDKANMAYSGNRLLGGNCSVLQYAYHAPFTVPNPQ